MTYGGDGGTVVATSQETRARRSNSNHYKGKTGFFSGKQHRQESKEQYAISIKKYWKGVPEEQRKQHMNTARKARDYSDPTFLRNASLSHIGKKDSEETKKRKRQAQIERWARHRLGVQQCEKPSEICLRTISVQAT